MLSNIDKVAEKIPYFNGGFRRRMTSGTIVVLSLLPLSNDISKLADYISAGTLALLFVLVHAIGGVIDVISSLFISRLAGNIAWIMERPKSLRTAKITLRKPMKAFLIVIGYVSYYTVWAYLKFIIGVVAAVFGISFYHWVSLKDQLTDSSSRFVDGYPEIVRLSLKDPFGKRRRFLWVYFAGLGATDEVKSLARRLKARNQEMLSIIAASMIGIYSFLFCFQSSNTSRIEDFFPFLAIVVIPFFLLFLFYAYIMFVRQSILTIIELNSTQLDASRGPDST